MAGIVIGGCDAVPVSLTGQASCQVTYPVAGSHSIVAAYSGDPAFASSGSPTLEAVVQPAQSAASAPPTQSVPPTQSAPPTQPVPAVSPGSAARGSVGNVRVSGRNVTASVTCKGASGSSCAIKLTLSAAASHGSAHKKTVSVGITRAVTVRAGKTAKITVSLNGTGRQLLNQHRRLGATLAIVQSQPASSATIFTRTVTFKKPTKIRT